MRKLYLSGILILAFFSLTRSAWAAQTYLDIIGFETGDSSESVGTAGTFSVTSTVVRTGTYALRVNPTTTGTGLYGVSGPLRTTGALGNNITNVAVTSTFARFYFRYATKPAANYEQMAMLTISGGSNQRMALMLNSSGTISMYGNSTSTEILAGTTVLAANTWYKIEFDMRVGTTPSFLMKLNGNTELSTSSVSLGAGNLGVLRLGKIFNINGNTVDFYYDDIAVTDTDFPPDGRVKMLVANASGTYQAWTNSTSSGGCNHWDCLNERPPTFTKFVLSTGSAGDAETEALTDTTTAGISGTVNAVKSYINVDQDASLNGNVKLRIRSGSTDTDMTALAIGSTITELEQVYNTDPSTGAAWTLSGVDGIEVGAVENATSTTRETRMGVTYAMVDYARSNFTTRPVNNLGLLGYWSFEDARGGKATDFSGQGNHGILTNFALSTSTSNWNGGGACKRGSCLNFDGANDYVTSTASGIANLGAFTVSAWFKTTTTVNGDIFSIGSSASLTPYIRITINRFGATGRVTLEMRDDASINPAVTSANAYNDGNWHQVVAVRNTATDHKLYIDGVQVGSDTTTTMGTMTVDRQCIGALCRTNSPSAYFSGSIDEVRIHNRALTPTEITNLYGVGVVIINASQNSQLRDGLVGQWSFNGSDLTNATATDRSGNGLDGTRMGGVAPTIGKVGQALNFDGGDDYVAVPQVIGSQASSSFSVSLWTKNNVTPGAFDGIISETDGGGWHVGFGIYYDSATQLNFFIQLWNINYVTSTINPLQWNHVVGTWDGTTMHLYVNGVLSPSSDTFSGGLNLNPVYPFEIGRVGDSAYNINGKIDEVRVYNRALSASEVLKLYNLGR